MGAKFSELSVVVGRPLQLPFELLDKRRHFDGRVEPIPIIAMDDETNGDNGGSMVAVVWSVGPTGKVQAHLARRLLRGQSKKCGRRGESEGKPQH